MCIKHKSVIFALIILLSFSLYIPNISAQVEYAAKENIIIPLLEEIRNNLKDKKRSLELVKKLEKLKPTTTAEVRFLLKLIADTSGDVQQKLINTVSNVDNRRLAGLFAAELENKHPMVVAVAAGMCGKLKINNCVPGLIGIIKRYGRIDGFADTSAERATVTAVLALGEIGDPEAIPVLLDNLGNMSGYEIKALVKFGNKAVPQLFDKIINGKDAKIRRAAAEAVVSITDPAAVSFFKKELLNKNSKVRKYAIIGLLNIEPEKNLSELLIMWKKNGDSMIEQQILYHINAFRLKDKKLCPFLIKVLKTNKQAIMRQKSVVALGRIGGDDAIAALKTALRDKEKLVRLYAAQALQMLTGKNYDANMSDI